MGEDVYAIIINGSFAVGLLGLIWKVSVDSGKKVDAIFRRFDDYKESVKKDFVGKEGCGIRHETLERDIQEIKTDVKILLRNGDKK